ncbi:hypothetical protein BC777_2705 [Yoonia maricola]|uniref:Uncharacterized protein n=2 Tax=Yoonia maricola TaxID=420999 RepID=A0A2M8W5X2_9RHOB|nr:hypothetical protein BC777_2705 [Yoonia maricola]
MLPAEELASRLDRDEFLTTSLIAEFIRKTPPKDWPQQLSIHVAGLLDRSKKAPRGRPPNKYQVVEDVRIQIHRRSALKVLQGETDDIPSEFVELVLQMKDDLEPSPALYEKAKAITSILILGHDGHVKKVQDRYSSKKNLELFGMINPATKPMMIGPVYKEWHNENKTRAP